MLKRTALFHLHDKLGARLFDFGGWELPVQYSGIVDEHLAVRRTAGIFDIAHMGQALIEGDGAQTFLNRVLTNDVRRLDVGLGQYTLMCNPRGGVVDDLYLYRVSGDAFLLILNASRTEVDLAWLEKQHPDVHADLMSRLDYARDVDHIRDMHERLFVPRPDPESHVIEQFSGHYDLEDITLDELRKRIKMPNEYLGAHGPAATTRII